MRHPTLSQHDWDLDDIPLQSIDIPAIQPNEEIFYLVTAASFVEIAADLYTANLISYFKDDSEVSAWLEHHWQHEEMRHGRALRGYVNYVWPEFDWERGYTGFFTEYSQLCTMDEFEPTRGLEMVARCVVETGTATFYQALSLHAHEPILAGIASRIRNEEVSHYKHFYQYFRQYNAKESPGRIRILGALKRRVVEARNSDADCALWHAFVVRDPERSADKAEFKALCKRIGQKIRRHYPVAMAVKMVMKPLGLPPLVNRLIQTPVAKASGWLFR